MMGKTISWKPWISSSMTSSKQSTRGRNVKKNTGEPPREQGENEDDGEYDAYLSRCENRPLEFNIDDNYFIDGIYADEMNKSTACFKKVFEMFPYSTKESSENNRGVSVLFDTPLLCGRTEFELPGKSPLVLCINIVVWILTIG